MQKLIDRIDPARAWLAAAGGIVAALVVGSLLFPRRVYDGFLWRYYWGPVVADGNREAECALRQGGETVLLESGCSQASGVVATPGYTTVSTVTYAFVLVFALVGVLLLLRRLDLDYESALFYALVPYVFFGGRCGSSRTSASRSVRSPR
jgi:uncharacterized membrane protein